MKSFENCPVAVLPPNLLATKANGWRVFWLIGSHAIALFLVLAWFVPPFSQAMAAIDLAVFRTLNGSLTGSPAWQWGWALANHRAFDLVSGCCVLGLLMPYLWQLRNQGKRVAILTMLLFVCALGTGRVVIGDMLVMRLFRYHRASPTLVLADTNRLSELVPSVHAKDESPWSFPGDHGFVLFSVALFLTSQTRGSWRWIAWAAAVLFSLPRLMSGAHWTTDILVGSLSMALFTMGWLIGSPLLVLVKSPSIGAKRYAAETATQRNAA